MASLRNDRALAKAERMRRERDAMKLTQDAMASELERRNKDASGEPLGDLVPNAARAKEADQSHPALTRTGSGSIGSLVDGLWGALPARDEGVIGPLWSHYTGERTPRGTPKEPKPATLADVQAMMRESNVLSWMEQVQRQAKGAQGLDATTGRLQTGTGTHASLADVQAMMRDSAVTSRMQDFQSALVPEVKTREERADSESSVGSAPGVGRRNRNRSKSHGTKVSRSERIASERQLSDQFMKDMRKDFLQDFFKDSENIVHIEKNIFEEYIPYNKQMSRDRKSVV